MEVMQDSIAMHVYTIYLLLAIMVFNLITILNTDNFVKAAKKIKLATPFFHFINALIIYTGAIVAAFSHDLSPTVILMIIAAIFIMVLEIKRYKKMRVIKSDDIVLQEEFKIYSKKIYFIEIFVLIFVYIISKLF